MRATVLFKLFGSSGFGILTESMIESMIESMVSLMVREDERERESGELEPRGMKREAEKEPPWVKLLQ